MVYSGDPAKLSEHHTGVVGDKHGERKEIDGRFYVSMHKCLKKMSNFYYLIRDTFQIELEFRSVGF